LPTTLEIDEARARWRELSRADEQLAPIARFHQRWLELLASREAPDVALRLTGDEAERALEQGTPFLLAGHLEVDLAELDAHLRIAADALAQEGNGPAAEEAKRIASGADDLDVALGAALRGEAVSGSPTLGSLIEFGVQPALWAAAAQAVALVDLSRWSRGYCPVCGAWPLYGELSGPQRERHLRCGRCGADWSWAVLLCPYCGNDDHRKLGHFDNPDEREFLRVDTCEDCRGYLKGIASFTPASALRVAAEDAATLHLDVAARERGYERPGRTPDAARAGVPRSLAPRGGASN